MMVEYVRTVARWARTVVSPGTTAVARQDATAVARQDAMAAARPDATVARRLLLRRAAIRSIPRVVRPHIERGTGGCYTGGIDTHGGRGWTVRSNRFVDICCAGEGLAEHAIHFWSAARDTVVENNVILNCARGIGFGLVQDGADRPCSDDPYPGVGYIGHYDGFIRNNVIYADNPWFDTGIELDQAHGAHVYHNTVFSTSGATGFFSSIDLRFANTDADVRNNLTVRVTTRDGAHGRIESNVESTPASTFVNPSGVNFHLASGATNAIDQGVTLTGAGVDLDGDPHTLGSAPDIGADEYR